jgi:hypothetical protein
MVNLPMFPSVYIITNKRWNGADKMEILYLMEQNGIYLKL